MTAAPQKPVVRLKPQDSIYTLLLVVAIVVLGATIGIVLYNLMTVYGLGFADLFKANQIPPA